MKSRLVASVWIAMVGATSIGCITNNSDEPCPASPEVDVTLSPGAEEVRALPVLESGSTQLLGINLADSHGDVSTDVDIEGVQSVDLVSLSFDVTVDENPLDIDITRQDSAGEEVGPSSELSDETSVRTLFRAENLSDIALPEGVAYTATYQVAWRKDFPGMCPPVREGTTTVEVPGHVAAPVDTGSFAVKGTEANEAHAPETTGGARFKLFAEVTSGLEVTLRDVSATVTYFGADSAVPALGIASIENPAVLVDGSASDTIGPDQTLEIFSTSEPDATPPPYEPAGTSATTGNVAGGKALIEVTIQYEPTDGTAGVQTSTLIHAVDVPGDGGLL